MASLLCKKQNGILYIYGAVSYRRESDKQPRCKMTCLGKINKDTNEPIYNDKYQSWMTEHGLSTENALANYMKRNNKTIQISQKKESNESIIKEDKIKDISDESLGSIQLNDIHTGKLYTENQIKHAQKIFYGSTYLLDCISEKIGLTKIINDIFLDDAKRIMSLAYFNVIEHRPSMYCKYFVDNYNTLVNSNDVVSQRISELLNSITEKDKLNFFRTWSDKINDNDYLSLDTTSVSTYSTNIIKASYGHNKQGENLKQVNICLLFGEESRLPAYTTLYDGALHDVSTLISTIKQTSIIQNKSYKLVLDRGFYSKKNINYLLFSNDKADFLISVPGTTLLKNELIEEHKYIFDNIIYAIDINNDKLFGITKCIKWDKSKNLYAHIYVDPVKNDSSRRKIIDDFNLMYNNAIKEPEKYINDRDYRNMLIFRKSYKSKTGYIIKKNQKAYQDMRSKAGWFILLSNSIKDPTKAIEIYRKRDLVEKCFDILKNFINQKRTKVHNDIKNENRLFISFISMVLISYIDNVMKDNNLYKTYTLDELLYELSSIKAIKIDNYILIDPLTKKVKDIFDSFNFKHPE
ncbi:MAG: transposase [Candidatus Peribacteria bacterium]|jgi:transposase|nr:transposase [Candidatus Peribacteria bacterium]